MAQGPEDGLILGVDGFLGPYDEASQRFVGPQFESNMQKLVASIISYGKYKKLLYEKNTPRKDLNVIDASIKFAKSEKDNFVGTNQRTALSDQDLSKSVDYVVHKDASEKYANAFTQIGQFEAKSAKNDALVDKYCGREYTSDPNRLHQEIALNIRKAILQLYTDISGQTKEIVEVRNFIQKLLVIFANSWETFKSSYILNFCLYGGAGVGKTTLAKAIARCLTAYGILATEYIKEANKADFIAQYLGQTVYKTDAVLYGSLEGVCFIDEAYAIGKTKNYGQEFLDELTFFTQKFPGCLCVIVAGYEKEMKRHFFEKNEGLYRRFPNTFELRPYDIDTINQAISLKTISRLEIKDENEKAKIEQALQLHKTIIELMYMDVTKNFTSRIENATVNFPLFIVHSISTMSKLGKQVNPQKANVLKVYMLHKYVGINGGDFFPNQMGDVQNIVDKITMDSAINGGAVKYKNALKSINDYLRIRNAGYVYLTIDDSNPAAKKFNFAFSASKQHPDIFTRNVLVPLALKIYETPELYKKVHGVEGQPNLTQDEVATIKNNYDKLYTEAVKYINDYMTSLDKSTEDDDQTKQKLSTHLVVDFIFQEMGRYQRIIADDRTALLSFEEGVPAPLEGDAKLETDIGEIPVAADHTPDAACQAGPQANPGARQAAAFGSPFPFRPQGQQPAAPQAPFYPLLQPAPALPSFGQPQQAQQPFDPAQLGQAPSTPELDALRLPRQIQYGANPIQYLRNSMLRMNANDLAVKGQGQLSYIVVDSTNVPLYKKAGAYGWFRIDQAATPGGAKKRKTYRNIVHKSRSSTYRKV